MSGRRRRTLSPSLFPFLAVLVCTLGTLILLLALVAQNATETAEQNARAQQLAAKAKRTAAIPSSGPPRMTAETAESKIAEQRFRVEQLVTFRNQQTADLEYRRDQLTHLEDHLERLRKKLKQLGDEVENAMGLTPLEEIDDKEITRLRASIEAEQAAIKELRDQPDSKTPRVVIVPHKGPNGTDRRPVYLECDPQGVTVWPEGSRITIEQLNESITYANPLDAALRAVRFHAMRNYGDTTPPYPLLIVRPNGIETYGAARKAMLDWDDQFGYELVPTEVELAYSKPDSNLKKRVDLAIREAAAKQQALSTIAQNASRGFSGSSSGSISGLPSRRMPVLSAATLDRAGRASGFRSAADDYRASSSPLARSPYTSRSPSVSGSRNGSMSGGMYGGEIGNTRVNGSYANMDPSASTRELADQMRAAAREMRSNSGSGSGRTADTDSGSDEIQDGLTARKDQNPNGKNENAGRGTDAHSQSQSQSQSQSKSAEDFGSGGDATHGQTGGANSESPSSLGEFRSQLSSTAQASNQNVSRSGGSQSSAPMSMQTGSAVGSSQQQPQSTSSSQPSLNASASRAMVQRQGSEWALPRSVAGMGGNSIVRTIRVKCYADRLVLLPPSTGGPTEVFGFSDGNLARASLELASAVRDRVERWGASLPGGRWQPRLDVEVVRGGESRFHELKSFMNGSGVEVTGRTAQ